MAQDNHNSICLDWLRAVEREAPGRRAVVLYGGVRDIFYDHQERQYVTLPELLLRHLTRDSSLGFTLAGQWDHVDGLRFTNGRMLTRFREAIRQNPRAPDNGAPAGPVYDVGKRAPAHEPAMDVGPYRDPGELLPALRLVFANPAERPLVVLDWNQLLIGQPSSLAVDERTWMLQLGKTFVGPALVPMDSDHLRHGGGLMIILTSNLATLPPLLYQGESRIRLIPIPQPSRTERRAFFLRHADDVRCEQLKSTSGVQTAHADREQLADALADLTDGLNLVDLRQILSLSLRTESPLPLHQLLNLYRFGDQRSPWQELSEDKLRCVEDTLSKRVIGQDEAVQHVSDMLIAAYIGLAGLQHSGRRGKPKGTLFFVGPTGVGKTELAKALAEVLFGDETACIRFDMSEYGQEHSDQRLIGAPPGYVGFEEGGQLTNAVRKRPFSVLLFDEIDKAHPRILDKFLQILEDGRLTDGRGETAHFSECVLIFTSNIGAANVPANADLDTLRAHFTQAVEDHFIRELRRPELLNRLGENVVVFNQIGDGSHRRAILRKQLGPVRAYLQERFGVDLQLTGDTEIRYMQAARLEHGGRGLGNVIERDLVRPLSRFMFDRMHQLRRGRTVAVAFEDNRVTFTLQEG